MRYNRGMSIVESGSTEDPARHVNLMDEGVVEELVGDGRTPVLVPRKLRFPKDGSSQEKDVVFCHIPPRGTVFRDEVRVSAQGDIEFIDPRGVSRGKTVLRILNPEEGAIVKERRNAVLRRVTQSIREEKQKRANAIVSTR